MSLFESKTGSEQTDDPSAFEQLRKDLRELPTPRTRDDFLLRVRNAIETAQADTLPSGEPATAFRWNWMRSRMIFISSIAGMALISVVAVTLLRNPELPARVPAGAPMEAVKDNASENNSPPAARPSEIPASVQEKRSDAAASDQPASMRAEGKLSNKPTSAMPSGATPSGAMPSTQNAAEKIEAGTSTSAKEAVSDSKAKAYFEQDYLPMQKKELIKMRTGAAAKDSAGMKDSVYVRPGDRR